MKLQELGGKLSQWHSEGSPIAVVASHFIANKHVTIRDAEKASAELTGFLNAAKGGHAPDWGKKEQAELRSLIRALKAYVNSRQFR